MKTGLRFVVTIAGLLATANASAQPTSDPRIADLVRAGKVQFGTFPPQYTKDAATNELKGPWVEVMRALGAHMRLPVVLIELPTPAKLVECLDTGPCDIGSLGFDPTRAGQVGGFTPPFMQVEYTYLVPSASTIRGVADMDQPGVRIAVVRNHASTLALSRIAKLAELVTAETPDAAFALLRSRKVDAWASVRPALMEYSAEFPGSRVDSYGANFPALVVQRRGQSFGRRSARHRSCGSARIPNRGPGEALNKRAVALTRMRERIRDVRQGPDGALYVATDNSSGRILRLSPGK